MSIDRLLLPRIIRYVLVKARAPSCLLNLTATDALKAAYVRSLGPCGYVVFFVIVLQQCTNVNNVHNIHMNDIDNNIDHDNVSIDNHNCC